MIAQPFKPDPRDMRCSTIQQLFFNQMKALSVCPDATVEQKMKTFDLQFSDAWF